MKKILCALLCVLALTACGSAENAPAADTVTETSANTETASETEAETVHNNDTENPPPTEEKREFKGDIIRVTAVDGDVITGEKMSGGRGFGGRPDGNAPFFDGEMPEKGERPEGEPPEMPEDGSMPENGEKPDGEPPAMPEKGDKNFDGERPEGETVTFTITDSTVMDTESISVGDMITAELNEDGTATMVKAADMPARREVYSETEQ